MSLHERFPVMLPDFSIRADLTEQMDDPHCSEEYLLRTIAQFASINCLFSRYRTLLRHWILADMLTQPSRTYHLVDMGAGGCDICVWLLKAARKRRLRLHITACDLDARILDYAHNTYGDVEGLTLRRIDLLSERLDEPVDYVFANHFLHHLTNDTMIELIRLWRPLVRRRLLFSDLERNRFSYLGFSIVARVYRRSFARSDGLISIRRGFRAAELEAIAREAIGAGIGRVHRLAPGRLALCIDGNAPEYPCPEEFPPYTKSPIY